MKRIAEEVIGQSKKIGDIIGSWKYTIIILSVKKWEDSIRYSRQCQLLLDLEKRNSVEVIIKKWRKNIIRFLI